MKTLIKILSPFLALSILLASCTASVNMAASDQKRISDPDIPTGDLKTLVDGNNAFALDMYQALRSEDGNLILSPYSISLALAMTFAGARGETESQMANVLHFSQPQVQLHPAFNALDLTLEKSPGNFEKDQQPMTLNIANAVWTEQTLTIQKDFLDTIALNYGAGVHLADFINKYEPARREINNWVSDKTNKKIQDLLPEGSVDTDTRMALVNAIYFKADWRSQFNAASTSDAPFFLLDGSQVIVKTMHLTMSFPYINGDGYQAVELEYAGETAAMDIIIPDEGNYDAFESSFRKETYDLIISSMEYATVDLGFPKFTFTRDLNINNVLTEMGMPDAFNRDLADFSGITTEKRLYIENVFHKAFVAVDEKGTEAAAATAVLVAPSSLPEYLNIDHPFIFVIRDTVHGQILFIGRVLNPAE